MFKTILSSTTRIVLLIIAFIALIILNWNMWSKWKANNDYIRDLQKQLVIQQQENNVMQEANTELRRRIDSLKRGSVDMIEEEARNNFGMVGEGETFFDFKSSTDEK